MEILNTFWCTSKHHRGSKSITAKHVQEYRDVAPKVHTQEEFDDLCEFALGDLPPNNDGKLWMSNLANSVDNWLRSKEQSQQTSEEQENTWQTPISRIGSKIYEICEGYKISGREPKKRVLELYEQCQERIEIGQFLALMERASNASDIEAFFEQVREAVPMGVEV